MQTINILPKTDYIVVQIQRGKANAINQLMVDEIRTVFKNASTDDTIKGVVMTGIPHFFSAGLDIVELYDYDEAQMRKFFMDFSNMHLELARFPKPFVCALTGHSPAGGTVIALAADYRVMAAGEQYIIGLNEVAVNIQISQKLVESYAFWIGRNLAHTYIMDGKLLKVKEAVACGLVSEVVPLDKVLERAEQQMQHYLTADQEILRNTKAKVRKSWLDQVAKYPDNELEQALHIWWKPAVRARMKAFADRLAKR